MEKEQLTIAPPSRRSLEEIRASLTVHLRTAAESCIRAGLDLIEAKERLGHGEFLPFLQEFGISSSTASNWMRVAREIPADSPLAQLSPTKALALLSVPAQEREAAAEEMDAENRSAQEIRRLIAERQKAIEAANSESTRADEAEKRLEELQAQYDALSLRPPVEERIVEAVPADYTQLKKKAEKSDQIAADALRAATEAEQRARKAEDELEALRIAQPDAPPDALSQLQAAANRFMADTQFMALNPGPLAAREQEFDRIIRKLSAHVIELQSAVANAGFEITGVVV